MGRETQRCRHEISSSLAGSAGSFSALLALTAALPQGFPASLLVALHGPKHIRYARCRMLNQSSWLPVVLASDGTVLERSQIYLIPGGMHAQVGVRCVHVEEANERDLFRPSVDRLFRSAAATYGERVIGVVLSGLMDDGAAGLAAIVRAGGVGVVQSPLEAQFGMMPYSAHKAAPGSFCLPVAQIAALLGHLVAPSPLPLVSTLRRAAAGEEMAAEVRIG